MGVRLPLPPAVPVYVQCDNTRFLAYLDEDQVWRHFFSQQRVEGRVTRVPYEAIQ